MTSAKEELPEECKLLLTGIYENYLGNMQPDNFRQKVRIVLNSKGFRCKEFEEINKDDYILFTGCSHTAGYGLHVEDTYPYIVSDLIGKSYYNLAVGGSGIDVLYHNLAIFFTSNLPKPKALVIQNPFLNRFARIKNSRLAESDRGPHVAYEGNWSTNKSLEFTLLGEEIGFFDMRLLMLKKLIENLNIPIVTINLPVYGMEFYPNSIPFEILDYALDNLHYGPKSHKQLANSVIDKLKML